MICFLVLLYFSSIATKLVRHFRILIETGGKLSPFQPTVADDGNNGKVMVFEIRRFTTVSIQGYASQCIVYIA